MFHVDIFLLLAQNLEPDVTIDTVPNVKISTKLMLVCQYPASENINEGAMQIAYYM